MQMSAHVCKGTATTGLISTGESQERSASRLAPANQLQLGFIMSDVAPEATFGNPLEPWTPDRVAGALRQLTSLHGKSWNSNETDYPWLYGEDGTKLANPMRTIIRALLRPGPWAIRFAEEGRPPVAPALQDRERLERAYELLWAYTDANTRFHAIVHGDNHVGNTLIARDGTPGFIDWQCLQYGSAIHDFSYFLTGALTVDDPANTRPR